MNLARTEPVRIQGVITMRADLLIWPMSEGVFARGGQLGQTRANRESPGWPFGDGMEGEASGGR